MRGMILKDFYMIKTQGKIMMLILLFYSILSVMSGNIQMGAFVFLFVAIMPMSNLTYDEHYKWDGYALSSPVGRKGMVKARYLFCLLMMAVTVLMMAVLIIAIMLFKGDQRPSDMLRVVLVSVSVAALYQTILLPVMIKLGSEKGRIVMIAVIIVPTLAFMLYSKSSLPKPTAEQVNALSQRFSSPVFPVILLALVALMYAASYAVSLRVYRKKEF